MSTISGIHSYNPCRFIGATVTAFIKDVPLKEKIIVLATAVFCGLASFFNHLLFSISFSVAWPISAGISLLVLFGLAVEFGYYTESHAETLSNRIE